MTNEQANELFLQYKQTGDVNIRNQIVEKYLYIADVLAKKFVGRGVEYDDLRQVAALALIKGIDRFNADLGLKFSTFITPTITGEIKNYFRDKARTVKLPRQLAELNAKVKKFSADYETQHGVKPSVSVIASGLACKEEEVVEALEIYAPMSLDSSAKNEEGEQTSLYTLIADKKDAYSDVDRKETLQAEIRRFSQEERDLIKYRYYQNLSQSATAQRLGVSQMTVSRMEEKVIEKLKKHLKGIGEL